MSPFWAAELRGAALLLGACLVLIAIAEAWARLAKPPPEWTRKLVHLGGGFICLAFPFLLHSAWTVLAIALCMSASFALGARLDLLHALHKVDRRTRGSEYYPLAIFLLFLIGRAWPHLYVASVLTLGIADAGAAIIGSRLGRIRYEIEDDTKSLEGSLVFFALALATIALPLLLMTDYPAAVIMLSALYVALLVTGFEAISLNGADNLFVPFGVCVILHKILDKPLAEILWQNSAILLSLALVVMLTWRSRAFNTGATIGLALFTYGAWGLCSGAWAVPAFGGLLLFALCWRYCRQPDEPRVRLRLLVRVLLTPFLVIVLANATGAYDWWLIPYTAACVTVVALVVLSHLRRAKHCVRLLAVQIPLLATLIMAAPLVIAGRVPPIACAIIAGLAIAAILIDRLGDAPPPPLNDSWTARRFVITAAVIAASAALTANYN